MRKINTGILIAVLMLLALSGCKSSEEIQSTPTTESLSSPTTIPSTPPLSNQNSSGPILISAGSEFFLPFQSCFDLDQGTISAEEAATCDIKVQPAENDKDRIYLQFNFFQAAAFAFESPFSSPPTLEDCKGISSYSSEAVIVNPLDTYLCYQTKSGHYGSFSLKDWDADHGITFNWQTFANDSDFQATEAAPIDAATFIADLTVLDGTEFAPGETFQKGWRLRNSGTTTWTLNYQLVFVNGDRMDGPEVSNLPIEVPSNESLDLYVNLTAPEAAGEYTGYWMLKNEQGDLFGIGFEAKDTFYVKIQVTEN